MHIPIYNLDIDKMASDIQDGGGSGNIYQSSRRRRAFARSVPNLAAANHGVQRCWLQGCTNICTHNYTNLYGGIKGCTNI